MAAITQHPTAKADFANPTTSQIIFIRKRDLFPKSIKLAGGKAVAWLESDIGQWQKQCLANQAREAK